MIFFTEELLNKLRNTDVIDDFVNDLPKYKVTLPDYLNTLLDEKDLKRSTVIQDAYLNETFGYQIFVGQRNASRDKLLQLAFGIHATLEETNRILFLGATNTLYSCDRRDAIIIFSIDHCYTLQKTNEELFRLGEKTLC